MAEERTKTKRKVAGETTKRVSAKKPGATTKKAAAPRKAAASKAKSPAAKSPTKTSRKAPASKPAAAATATPLTRRPKAPRPEKPLVVSEEARQLALAAAAAGLDKKAVGIEILDVLGKVDYTDYLVLMTGRSDRHVDSIAQGILEALEKEKNKKALSIEGLQAAVWVLIDFGDIVVHVFQEEARETYDIAGLWLDAARLPMPEGAGE